MQLIQSLFSSGFNIVLVVVGLGLIIFLHEFGHFIMAKKNGVRVEVFSLGFGAAIWSFRRGETEYRVAWLPLGGYVKMAGEAITDARNGEPWELTSKTPWQRFQIFVAGATMNLLIAFPIGIAAYAWGMRETTNEISTPGTAEGQAGMRPGDVVIDVDGRKIRSLDKFRIEMIRRQQGTQVPVTVLRDGKEVKLTVTTGRSEKHFTDPASAMLGKVKEGSPLAKAGVQAGDEICAIDGRRVWSGGQADALLRGSGGKEATLRFRRRQPDFKDKEFDAVVKIPQKTWYVIPADDHVVEVGVGAVPVGGPSGGILEAGDKIVRIGDKPVACWKDLKDAMESRTGGDVVEVAVERGSETKTVRITLGVNASGTGMLGVANQKGTGLFAKVAEGSLFSRSGLRSGDRLIAIEGHSTREFEGLAEKDLPPAQWKVPPIMGIRSSEPRTIALKVVGADKAEREVKVTTDKVEEGDLAALGLDTTSTGGLIAYFSKPYRRRDFGEAFKAGMYEPVDITVMTFEVLRKLVTGGESPRGLSGPIGILHATYSFADQAFGNFIWMLCLITVNLGVFNLLPIPVLDGGHNVLLLIEVIRKWVGKPPPSEKFVAAFQYSGLLFILSLFLFVTYNDISRLFRG